MSSHILEFLRSVLAGVRRTDPAQILCFRPPEADPAGRSEPPPWPIRWWVHVFGCVVLLLGLLLALLVGNPVARVRDYRRATHYDHHPLTSMSAMAGDTHVWVGTAGGGIEIYDASCNLFDRSLTRETTGGTLLSDDVPGVALGAHGLTAVLVSPGSNQPCGVQVASRARTIRFWPRPLVGMETFPGLQDRTASAVAASPDGRLLAVGTRGSGVGVYDVEAHAWRAVITQREGLPSDCVNDLVVAGLSPADPTPVLWVATDRGLAAGAFTTEAAYHPIWCGNRQNGLAGDEVVALATNGVFLWYNTGGNGLGRVTLGTGAPGRAPVHELIVSERRLPGLTDNAFRLAAGVPAAGRAWFVAEIAGVPHIGRYSEWPHDTIGTRLPDSLDTHALTCLAPDVLRGDAVLVGSSRGIWCYADTGPGSWQPETVAARPGPAPDVQGGCAGLDEVPVLDAVLRARLAVAKIRRVSHAALCAAAATPAMPWTWSNLVGDGRFPSLTADSDVTCAAMARNGPVYFGTANKGIGMWDRRRLEVRRALHSSDTNEATRLRCDTSLALAVTGDGALLQVTGDHAVDLWDGTQRLPLVPPGAAPFGPSAVETAVADGTRLAGAGAGAVAWYDMADFTWHSLPGLTAVTQLAIVENLLWALERGGRLQTIDLSAGAEHWHTVVASGVSQVVVAGGQVHALLRPANGPGRLLVFRGADGSPAGDLCSVPLPAGDRHWRFAAAFDETLCLSDGSTGVDCYDLSKRAWRAVAAPADVSGPWRAMAQTRQTVWIVDAAGTLHRFAPDTGAYRTAVDRNVVQVFGGAQHVLVQKTGDEARIVLHTDAGEAPRTVVGRKFTGDLAAVDDALDFQDALVVAQGRTVGFYQWSTHDWWNVAAPAERVEALFAAGGKMWALGASPEGKRLYAWSGATPGQGRAAFTPVTSEGREVLVRKVVGDATSIALLATDGRVLSVLPSEPAHAVTRLAATRLDDPQPAQPRPEHWGLLGTDPVVYHNQALHIHGPSAAVPQWQRLPLADADPQRLVTAPDGAQVLVQGRQNLWSLGPNMRITPLLAPVANGARAVLSVAAGANEGACTFRAGSETAIQAVAWPYRDPVPKPLVGPAWPAAGATRAVIGLPPSDGLLRLDAAGQAGLYDPVTHGWRIVASDARIDDFLACGRSTVGFSRDEGTLLLLRDDGWRAEAATRGRILRATPTPDGLLLWLKDGALALLADGDRQARVVRAAPPRRRAAGPEGPIVDAAEADEILFLQDATGRVSAFDWREQQWLALEGQVQQLVRSAAPQGVYALCRPPDGDARIAMVCGPLTRAATAPRGCPGAVLAGSAGVTRLAAAGRLGLFAVGPDQAIHRLEGDRFAPWWGGTRREALPLAGCPILDARAEPAGVRLVLQQGATNLVALHVESGTLRSYSVPFGSGRADAVVADGAERFALVSEPPATGRWLANLGSGARVAYVPELLSEVAVADGNLCGLASNGVYVVRDRKWRHTDLPGAAALPGTTNRTAAADPRIVGIEGVEGALVCRLEGGGATAFRCTATGTWQRLGEEDVRRLAAQERPRLAGTYGSFSLQPAANGLWCDGVTGGTLNLGVQRGATVRRLRPAAMGGGLAHEMVRDVMARDNVLYAATDDGVAVLTPSDDGRTATVALNPGGDGLPDGPVTALRAIPGPAFAACAADGSWYREVNGAWQSEAQPAFASGARAWASSYQLDHWRLVDTGAGTTGALERRFADGTWQRLAIDANGFDMERVYGAESEGGRLVLYTDAGRAVCEAGASGVARPAELDPAIRRPAGFAAEAGCVVRVAEDRTLLAYGPDPAAERVVWVREQKAWRPLNDDELRPLRQARSGPFLQSEHWVWERAAAAGGAERVTWKPADGAPIVSDFTAVEGRFGWDRCRAVGQSEGDIWLLTDAGLVRVAGQALDLRTFVALSGDARQRAFADVSGLLPGALCDRAGALELVGLAHGWRPAREAPADVLAQLRDVRLVGALWSVERNGDVRRVRPQDPAHRDVVALVDNRWSFETVHDVAVRGGICHVATDGGVIALSADNGSLVGLWGEPGRTEAVCVRGTQLFARGVDGRVQQEGGDGGAWRAATWPAEGGEALAGKRWTRVRPESAGRGVTFGVCRQTDGANLAVAVQSGDFAFDRVSAIGLTGAGTPVLATADGLVECGTAGDLAAVAGAARDQDYRLFGVESTDQPDVPALFAAGSRGQSVKWAGAWNATTADEVQTALTRHAQVLASGPHWRALVANGGIDLYLHLDSDPAGLRRKLRFDPAQGGFASDDLRCVARLGNQALALGTSAGLAAFDGERKLVRLWCDADIDGLGLQAVDRIVSAGPERALLLAGGDCRAVAQPFATLARATRPEFDAACRALVDDPAGWRVECDAAADHANVAFHWRGQPAFLLAADSGGSRFAHNIVQSVVLAGERVIFGTAGGVLQLPAATPAARRDCLLRATPFLSAAGARSLPTQLLLAAPDAVLVRLRDAGAGRVCRMSLDSPADTPLTDATEVAWEAADLIGADDILQWRLSAEGHVDTAFVPGRAVPATARPQIADGTFAFLDLDGPAGAASVGDLAVTGDGLFCSSRGGIVQFDAVSSRVVRVHAATGDGVVALNGATHLRCAPTGCVLFAEVRGRSVRFETGMQTWVPATSAEGGDDALVLDGALMAWRRTATGANVAMKKCDRPGAPCFVNGKPPMDVVHAFACDGPDMRVATDAGVASYGAAAFTYLGLEAAAFAGRGDAAAAVVSIAAASVTNGSPCVVCRTGDGRAMARRDGVWQEAADVEPVFAASYCRVDCPGRWRWARYPEGLACTLRMVYGAPLALGVNPVSPQPPIFSRGKLAFDDVRALAFAGADRVLLATPVGVARHRLDAERRTAVFEGLDARTGAASEAPRLADLERIDFDNRTFVLTGPQGVFEGDGIGREWRVAPPATASQSRTWYEGASPWVVTGAKGGAYRVARSGGSWYVAGHARPVRAIAHSDDGLWFLAGDEIYHVNAWRARLYCFGVAP